VGTASTNGSAPAGHWMAPRPPPPDRRARALAVAAGAGAALAVWVVAHPIGGITLAVQLSAGAQPGVVGPLGVLLVATSAGLAGWGLLGLLEHVTAQARTIWRFLAWAALVASLAAPLGAGTTTASKAALAAMHAAVAAVVVPGLARTSRKT
jgi:hypothetical protein